MGFGVKLLCWMVHYVFRMVHDGTQGEASDALRIRYAPRAEILGDARVSAFFARKYHQTYHCCILDSCREGRTASPLGSCFLILADEPFQLVCGLLTHVGVAMTVHV